jgi:heme-degrading monooxygenase HmoA
MIERVWSARTTRERASAYVEYFRRVVLPELGAIRGYRGATVAEREAQGVVEVVVTTRWESIDAIRAFAGDDLERAVVHDEAAALLSEYDDRVRHYGVVVNE